MHNHFNKLVLFSKNKGGVHPSWGVFSAIKNLLNVEGVISLALNKQEVYYHMRISLVEG